MVVLLLTIFNGCQKDDPIISQMTDGDQPQEVVTNPMFVGLNDIAFSVENNRLVFETEEDYQKCIDILTNLDYEDYTNFENEIGFISYKTNCLYNKKECLINDEVFATLINPEMQIIVEHYLFTIDINSKSVNTYFIDENCNLKSSDLNRYDMLNFSFDDDIFAILKSEEELKSISGYCGQEKAEHMYSPGGEGLIYLKVDYNKYGIYNSLVAQMKIIDYDDQIGFNMKTVNSPLGIVPPRYRGTTITSRCFYRRIGKQNNIIFDESSNNYNFKITAWSHTRRLKGFRLDVDFTMSVVENYEIVHYYDNLMIECHQY